MRISISKLEAKILDWKMMVCPWEIYVHELCGAIEINGSQIQVAE